MPYDKGRGMIRLNLMPIAGMPGRNLPLKPATGPIRLELDIYGELMDSVYLYNKYGGPISHDFDKNIFLEQL
jgi:hypothetical protein